MDPDQTVLEFVKTAFLDLKEMIDEVKRDTKWIKGELTMLRSKVCSSKEKLSPPATDFQGFEVLDIKDIPMSNAYEDTHNSHDFINEDENMQAESTTLNITNGGDDYDDFLDDSVECMDDGDALFPIQNVETLNKIELQINQGALQKYAKIIRDITAVHGLRDSFHKIFSEKFYLTINFNGSFRRVNLSCYTNFLNAMHEALKDCPEVNKSGIASYANFCLHFNKAKYYRKKYNSKRKNKKNRREIVEPITEQRKKTLNRDQNSDITFPLRTFDDIEKLNSMINKSNRAEYIETLKVLFRIGGIEKNFHHFLHEEMINYYNYDGVQGKLPFKAHENLLDVIRGAITADAESEISDEEFRAEIKNVFGIYKKTNHRRYYEPKKSMAGTCMEKTEEVLMEISQETKPQIEFNVTSIPLNEDGKRYKHKFPLRTQYALEMMEKMITPGNRHKYIRKFKEVLGDRGLQRNFHRIMSRELITQYNLTGFYKKPNLQDYKNIMDVLYEAAYEEKSVKTRVEFSADLVAIFAKKARN